MHGVCNRFVKKTAHLRWSPFATLLSKVGQLRSGQARTSQVLCCYSLVISVVTVKTLSLLPTTPGPQNIQRKMKTELSSLHQTLPPTFSVFTVAVVCVHPLLLQKSFPRFIILIESIYGLWQVMHLQMSSTVLCVCVCVCVCDGEAEVVWQTKEAQVTPVDSKLAIGLCVHTKQPLASRVTRGALFVFVNTRVPVNNFR